MVYIAKMTTRYPDFHGTGYYNFIAETDEYVLEAKVENNSHDFQLQEVKKTRFATVENLMKKYPTKSKLNEAFFV